MGYLRRVFAVGAKGYVLKKTAADSLIRAIRTVGAGGTYPVVLPSYPASPLPGSTVQANLLCGLIINGGGNCEVTLNGYQLNAIGGGTDHNQGNRIVPVGASTVNIVVAPTGTVSSLDVVVILDGYFA